MPVHSVRDTVSVWLTQTNGTTDGANTTFIKALEQQKDVCFTVNAGGAADYTICVDETKIYQKMDGFGASITDASGYLLDSLKQTSPNKYAEVIQQLFGKESGIGLSMLRQPIGECDHVVAPYSYAAQPDSDTLPNFDISHDTLYIIPSIQDALAAEQGRVKVMASVWSAPGWMKANNSSRGAVDGVEGRLTKHTAYANYFVKFIQAYAAHGIPIYAVTPANEPDWASPIWPALPMHSSEEKDFICNYLYPAFQSNAIDALIIGWDHNYSTTNYENGKYAYDLLSDEETYSKIAGTAWHFYGGAPSVMTAVHEKYPDKGIWFTEGSGGTWDGGYYGMMNAIIGMTRNWAQSAILWNLVLDQNSGPDYYYDVYAETDSTCRPLVTIHDSTKEVTYTVDYYALGHFSKFVEPGAYRIDSSSSAGMLETVAFVNPDNSKVLVVSNPTATAKTIDIRCGSRALGYTLPAYTSATFIWDADDASALS